MEESRNHNGNQTSTIVGIDEAGYGPLLGPLVVSAVAFDVPVSVLKEVPSAADGPDLWALLKTGITPKAAKRDPRLAVADSKKLHAKGGIALLERAALSFCWQNGNRPATLRTLLDAICPQAAAQMLDYPWYADSDFPLPTECSRDDVATQRNALANALSAAGVRFRGAWVEVLTAGHFNKLVEATHNKAVILFGQCTRLIQKIADDLGPRPLRVWIDRHGGRTCYRRPLMTAFEDAQLDIIEESAARSSYRLHRTNTPLVIRFVRHGEEHHLPIALASIFSKYVRELFMICFNRYWTSLVPGLRPTAGYYQDGQRFMADIEALIARQKLDRRRLVRNL